MSSVSSTADRSSMPVSSVDIQPYHGWWTIDTSEYREKIIRYPFVEPFTVIVVHAAFPIASDQRDQALEVFRDLVEASQNEPGVIKYEAATDVSDSNLIRNVEQYEDEDAFQAHLETDHVQDFDEVLPDLLAGEPDIVRFEVDSATDIDF